MLYMIKEKNILILKGDTYPIKEHLKNLGAKWNYTNKYWWINDPTEEVTQNLINLGFINKEPEDNNTDTTPIEQIVPTYTVKQIVQQIKLSIYEKFSTNYWIIGEISNIKHTVTHIYFDLCDNTPKQSSYRVERTDSFSCIIWENYKENILKKLNTTALSDGLKVKVLLSLDLRTDGARITGIIYDIDPEYTLGDLSLQRQRTVQELKRQNLYNRNKLLKLPPFPLKIALITASGSRAFSDFFDELKQSSIGFEITHFDCSMQGDNTALDISSALSYINSIHTNFDCVVITRGGGSKMDLRWFDDFELCKAIALTKLPVITAIGHFEDISVADEVAFLCEKTPTGAARFLRQHIEEYYEQYQLRLKSIATKNLVRIKQEQQIVARKQEKMIQIALFFIKKERKNIENMQKQLVQAGLFTIYNHKNLLKKYKENLIEKVKYILEKEKQKLQQHKKILEIHKKNFTSPLYKGFALVKNQFQKIITAENYKETQTEKIFIEFHSPYKNVTLEAHVITAYETNKKEK